MVGLGALAELDAERMRVAAALAVQQAGRYEATHVAWLVPAEIRNGHLLLADYGLCLV